MGKRTRTYCRLKTWGGGPCVVLFGSKTRCSGSAALQSASLELSFSSMSDSSAALWLNVRSV